MIKLRGRIKLKKGTTCNFDLLSDEVEKAWDARGVEDILENDELAKGIEEISISVKTEMEFNEAIPYYYIELKTTDDFWDEHYDSIMSCLTFEIGYGINEFLGGIDEFKNVKFIDTPMDEI